MNKVDRQRYRFLNPDWLHELKPRPSKPRFFGSPSAPRWAIWLCQKQRRYYVETPSKPHRNSPIAQVSRPRLITAHDAADWAKWRTAEYDDRNADRWRTAREENLPSSTWRERFSVEESTYRLKTDFSRWMIERSNSAWGWCFERHTGNVENDLTQVLSTFQRFDWVL
jgi:hypothetical protein